MSTVDITKLFKKYDKESYDDMISKAMYDKVLEVKSTLLNGHYKMRQYRIRGDGWCGLHAIILGYYLISHQSPNISIEWESDKENMFGEMNVFEDNQSIYFDDLKLKEKVVSYFDKDETILKLLNDKYKSIDDVFVELDGSRKYLTDDALKLLSIYLKVNIEVISNDLQYDRIFFPDRKWNDERYRLDNVSYGQKIPEKYKSYPSIILHHNGVSDETAHYELLIPGEKVSHNKSSRTPETESRTVSFSQTPSSSRSIGTAQYTNGNPVESIPGEHTYHKTPRTPNLDPLSPESPQFSPVQQRKLQPDINREVHDNPLIKFMSKIHIQKDDADFGEDYRKYKSYIKFLQKVKIEKYDDKKQFRDFMEKITIEKLSHDHPYCEPVEESKSSQPGDGGSSSSEPEIQTKAMSDCEIYDMKIKYIYDEFLSNNIHISMPTSAKDYAGYSYYMNYFNRNKSPNKSHTEYINFEIKKKRIIDITTRLIKEKAH